MFLIPFAVIFLFGYSIINKYYKEGKFLEKISLSWGLGSIVFTYLLFIFSFLGFKTNRFFVGGFLIFLIILNFRLIKNINFKLNPINFQIIFRYLLGLFIFTLLSLFLIKKRGYLAVIIWNLPDFLSFFLAFLFFGILILSRNKNSLSKIVEFVKRHLDVKYLEIGLLTLIAFLFISSFIIAIYWPIFVWDAITLFDSRAKIFLAQEKTILLKNQPMATYLTAYPFFTSSLHFLLYLFGVPNPQFIYSLYYLFLITSFYYLLREENNNLSAIFWATILALTPIFFEHSTFAYTNLAFAYYYGLGSLYMLSGIEKKLHNKIALGILFIAFSTWVRPGLEVFIFANLFFLLLIGLVKKNLKPLFLLIFFYLIINIPWEYYLRFYMRLEPLDSFNWLERLQKILIFDIEKIKLVIKGFFILMGNRSYFGYILYLFLFTLIISIKHVFKKFYPALILIIMNFFAWVALGYGIGLVWGFNRNWSNIFYDSMGRMTMAFTPLFIYIIARDPLSKRLFKIKGE